MFQVIFYSKFSSAMRQGFLSFAPADLLPFIKWTEVQRQVMFFKNVF